MALSWFRMKCECLPNDTIIAGKDARGRRLYVARAHHKGELLPGKLLEGHKYALISWNGKEIWKYEYEVLHGDQCAWIPNRDGNVPTNAVGGGTSKTGETLYVGRASYNGGKEPGKIQPSHRCMYFPYGSKEHCAANYDVLCHECN